MATSLPAHIYAVLPVTAVCSVLLLTYYAAVLSNVLSDSRECVLRMKQSQTELVDSDNIVIRHTNQLLRAQRPFGFKLGEFAFMSVGCAQDVIANAISYALLVISLAKGNK